MLPTMVAPTLKPKLASQTPSQSHLRGCFPAYRRSFPKLVRVAQWLHSFWKEKGKKPQRMVSKKEESCNKGTKGHKRDEALIATSCKLSQPVQQLINQRPVFNFRKGKIARDLSFHGPTQVSGNSSSGPLQVGSFWGFTKNKNKKTGVLKETYTHLCVNRVPCISPLSMYYIYIYIVAFVLLTSIQNI